MEHDLRGGLVKLQIGESGTTKCSAATKELLGDRNVLSVLMKNVTHSVGAQVQLSLGARPTYAGVRNPFVEYRLSKRQLNPTRHHAAHDDMWTSVSWTVAKGKESSSKARAKTLLVRRARAKESSPQEKGQAKRPLIGTTGNLDTDKRIARLLKLRQHQQFMSQLLHPRLSRMHKCGALYHNLHRPQARPMESIARRPRHLL